MTGCLYISPDCDRESEGRSIDELVALHSGAGERSPASRCRAGLFDCSLPAWPAGAWHDALQWPALLAGLAMLPMMAALPMMVAWCRVQAVDPQAMVALHFAAMFLPALLLRRAMAQVSMRVLSLLCALLLTTRMSTAMGPAPVVNATHYAQLAGTASDDSTRDHSLAARND